MKILLVNNSKFGGVEYYRAIQPNNTLSSLYPEYEFHSINMIHPTETVLAEKNGEPLEINDEWLSQFNLVHFIRQIGFTGWTKGIKDRLDRLGIPFGLDLDDYWHLPDNHQIAEEYKKYKITETIIESIKAAHFVTTTTEYLAKEIEQYNKNVFIIENGLDITSDQWQPEHISSEYMRFGFMLGSTHYHDLKKASTSINNIFRSSNKGYQIILAGFNATTKESNGTKIHSSPHVGLENLLTLRHSLVDNNYARYLKKCTKEGNELWASQKYFRLWSVPVEEWGHQYKHIDLSVVPLVDNKFNNCKSELKAIEAGFKGKGLIISNVKPYNLICNYKNAYLVNSSAEFYDKIKRALNNPNEVADKIGQLHQDVTKKYSLQTLTAKRKDLYDSFGA